MLNYLLLFSITASAQSYIPEGWKLSAIDQYDIEDRQYFKNGLPNSVEADFNGDGINDRASIVIENHLTMYALIVSVSTNSNNAYQASHQYQLLYSNTFSSTIPVGIGIANPEKVLITCTRNYSDCPQSDAKELQLKLPGIVFHRFNSSSSIFYWDENSDSFQQVLIRD